MQNLYDLFGQGNTAHISIKNTAPSFQHVQDAGVLKQKSNMISGKKKALGDVGNKIHGGNKNISSNLKQKIISHGLPQVTPKLKTLNLNEIKDKQNTNPRKIQNATIKSTPSIKHTERVPQSVRSKINVYVEEVDDISQKVGVQDKNSIDIDNCEEGEVILPDYDSFEDDDDECQGPWFPKRFFHNKEEIINVCSVVPVYEDHYCPPPDPMDMTFNTELDFPFPENELTKQDFPLPIDVPQPW